ncbi:MAG: GGDEF domain-containing protein [Cellulosilyticaceae bacterium]
MLSISQLDELEKWMEKLMRYTQLIVIGISILEVLMFLGFGIVVSGKKEENFKIHVVRYLLVPIIRNLVVVILGTIGIKLYINKNKKIAAYIQIIAISVICCSIIYTHSELSVLIGIIGIPMLLAICIGDRKFLDNISLLNLGLLLISQIQLVEVSKEPISIIIATLLYSIGMISVFYLIARGILAYYGDVLNCWRIVSEIKRIDYMTGLLCKQAIYDELEELIEDGRGSGMSIAIISIDDLDRIINIYGKEKRERIMREVGNIIKKITNQGIKIGRYSEEELIIVFENHGVMQVIATCELIRDCIYSRKFDKFLEGEISASIGIATLSDKTKDAIELILKGKEALKRAKDGGKNKTVVS